MRVAFLGLGIMGSRMAANLCAAGHELTVWNRTAEVAERFVAEHPGAVAAASPLEAGHGAEVVVTMVVEGAQVRELLLGGLGAARSAAPGSLCIDCSTIGPTAARELGSDLAALGIEFLDAPVTGSAPRAQDGTLVFMVGGERAAYERALPLLEVMGSLVVYAGASGQGQVIKVINNAVAAVNAAIVGQALLCGTALGADLDALVDVMKAGSGGSMMLELKSGPMRNHDYTTLFKLDHMLKDVRLCLEAGAAVNFPVRFGEAIEEVLAQASAMGHGDDDFAALIEVLEASADIRL
jgi:3-hydroxyisobutyrate dehydrogenase-like beta-hydroxyacid dehydrogenase